MKSCTFTAQKKRSNPHSGTSDSPLHLRLPLTALFILTLPRGGGVLARALLISTGGTPSVRQEK